MKYIVYKQFCIKYEPYDKEDTCKNYRYFTLTYDKEGPMFERHMKFRYDGCPMHSIKLFKFGFYWGEAYEWM